MVMELLVDDALAGLAPSPTIDAAVSAADSVASPTFSAVFGI